LETLSLSLSLFPRYGTTERRRRQESSCTENPEDVASFRDLSSRRGRAERADSNSAATIRGIIFDTRERREKIGLIVAINGRSISVKVRVLAVWNAREESPD